MFEKYAIRSANKYSVNKYVVIIRVKKEGFPDLFDYYHTNVIPKGVELR